MRNPELPIAASKLMYYPLFTAGSASENQAGEVVEHQNSLNEIVARVDVGLSVPFSCFCVNSLPRVADSDYEPPQSDVRNVLGFPIVGP